MEDTLRVRVVSERNLLRGLNPCSNGRYSQSMQLTKNFAYTLILILVLMEDTLRVLLTVETIRLILILILVLMEDTLRESKT